MVLGGVLEEVEQLARGQRVLVDHELVALGLEGGEAPVLAHRHRAGRRRCRIVHARQQRPSLGERDVGRTGDLTHRRRHVDVLDQCVDHMGHTAARRPHDQRHPHGRLVQDALGHHAVVAAHLTVVAGVDDPRVVEQAPALQRTDHVADGLVDDRDIGGVRRPHAPDGVVGHRLGVRDPHERVQERPVAARALDGGTARRAGHLDIDAAVPLHGLCRRVPGIMRAGEPDEEEERLGALVALDPLHRLPAVPGVHVGLERDGRRRRVPHRLALGGVLAVFVLALVAAVGDVLLVGIEQPEAGEIVGVAGRDLPDELVAGLEDLGEPERLEPTGHVVDVGDGELLVEIEMRLAQEGGVIPGLPEGPGVGRAVGWDLGRVRVHAVVAHVALRHERRTCRHAERALARDPGVTDTLCRQRVERRGDRTGVSGAPHHVGPVLVRHHEQNVGGAAGHAVALSVRSNVGVGALR